MPVRLIREAERYRDSRLHFHWLPAHQKWPIAPLLHGFQALPGSTSGDRLPPARFSMVPSLDMTALRTTSPWIRACRASGGYIGSTLWISIPAITPCETRIRFGTTGAKVGQGRKMRSGIDNSSNHAAQLPARDSPRHAADHSFARHHRWWRLFFLDHLDLLRNPAWACATGRPSGRLHLTDTCTAGRRRGRRGRRRRRRQPPGMSAIAVSEVRP